MTKCEYSFIYLLSLIIHLAQHSIASKKSKKFKLWKIENDWIGNRRMGSHCSAWCGASLLKEMGSTTAGIYATYLYTASWRLKIGIGAERHQVRLAMGTQGVLGRLNKRQGSTRTVFKYRNIRLNYSGTIRYKWSSTYALTLEYI